MNNSYEYWEEQFLNDMVIKFGFAGNHAVAFKQRLLLGNDDLNNANLADVLAQNFTLKTKGTESIVFRDCWHRRIFPTLKDAGFDCKDPETNPKGKYEKTWECVRTWLRFDIFPEYLKSISPQSSIEIWQELWEKAEDEKIYFKPYNPRGGIAHLGISTEDWRPEEHHDCPSFAVDSKIIYQLNLSYYGYLIVVEKFASGNFYCLAPSKLSPVFPVAHSQVTLPRKGSFTVEKPIGQEEIIAILMQDKPQLDWLAQTKNDPPLQLKTDHLADLLDYVKKNDYELMRGKYLIKD